MISAAITVVPLRGKAAREQVRCAWDDLDRIGDERYGLDGRMHGQRRIAPGTKRIDARIGPHVRAWRAVLAQLEAIDVGGGAPRTRRLGEVPGAYESQRRTRAGSTPEEGHKGECADNSCEAEGPCVAHVMTCHPLPYSCSRRQHFGLRLYIEVSLFLLTPLGVGCGAAVRVACNGFAVTRVKTEIEALSAVVQCVGFVECDFPFLSTSKTQMPSCAAKTVPLPSKAELAHFRMTVLSLRRDMTEAVQRTD